MKRIILTLITFYQGYCSPLFKHLFGLRSQCRFSPTCSEYTKDMIELQGVRKGLLAGIKQIMHCHPFSRTYGNLL